MKKIFVLFAAVAALVSCTKENHANENSVENFSVTLSATAPSCEDNASSASAQTRTTLVDGQNTKYVHWCKGDAIKVLFFPNRSNGNVITGPSGVFTSYFDEASSAEANFRCESWSWAGIPHEEYNDQRTNRLAQTGIAVYPSTATAVSNKPTSSTGAELDSEISFVLPEEQNAVNGNFESGLNFSYAEVDRDSFISTVDEGSLTELFFNNACALIQLTMPAEMPKKVTSISITSNDKVGLTGKGSLKLNYYQDVVEGGVTVTEGAGVVLNSSTGFEAGATYYAVVWPGAHTGLTIEFHAEDGAVATKTTGDVTLTASRIKPYTFSKGLDFIAPEEFDYIYADGTTGNDVQSNIVGVVIFRGNPKTQFNDPDLPDQYCNGLAIGTKNVSTYWGGTSALSNVPASVKMSSYSTAHANGGYTVKKIWNDNGFNSLPMYTNSSTVDISKSNTSGWYLPVNNEWSYILSNLSDINALLTAAGADTIDVSSSRSSAYWLPLAYSSNAITVYTDYYGTKAAYYYDWQFNTNRNARPIFAF